MRLPKFEHLQPASREEASLLLQEHDSRARLVAGGTDLYPRMKYGLA
ncbi:MAG: FAD binding domain-containing protein, partial [Deltaproteobacteria bacterium]|nr:FAD binding domain-containing protein [Deltaproteobacteria bacterium]